MKLARDQFIEFLRANGGIYSRTAQAIREQLGIPYTRQEVRLRALDLPPGVLEDIRDEAIEVAETRIQSLLRSRNERIALDTAKFFLATQGRHRGWGEKVDLNLPGSEPIQIEIIDKREPNK